jgi:hypothetical protein
MTFTYYWKKAKLKVEEIKFTEKATSYYIINTVNTYENLANFLVHTTFFSNHVMKEKMLAFMLKKKVGPLPARNSSLK